MPYLLIRYPPFTDFYFFLPYVAFLPRSKGMYRYLIMCLTDATSGLLLPHREITYCICLRMVKPNRTKKYINRIGQYTGMSKTREVVVNKAIRAALVADSQNLNSATWIMVERNLERRNTLMRTW